MQDQGSAAFDRAEAALLAQLHDLQSAHEDSYRTGRSLSAEVAALRAQVTTEYEARTAAEAELAALKRSTSWRITAPLRWFMGRLRG